MLNKNLKMMDQTHVIADARKHLHKMVELANCLISESINQTDPVLPPERTIPKSQFVDIYNQHSNELCRILDDLHGSDDVQPDDYELEKSRKLSKKKLIN